MGLDTRLITTNIRPAGLMLVITVNCAGFRAVRP